MKFIKKVIASTALLAMLGAATSDLQANEYIFDNGGCGYEDCCRCTSLAPAIALGTIVIVAIVAVAVQNTSGHSHCHCH